MDELKDIKGKMKSKGICIENVEKQLEKLSDEIEVLMNREKRLIAKIDKKITRIEGDFE